jgi:translocation and assembly module TamB
LSAHEPPPPPEHGHGLEQIEHAIEHALEQGLEAIPEPVRRNSWRVVLIVAIVTVTVLGMILVGARYGVLLPQGRFIIEAAANGLKIGRFGRLKVEGISGDIWRDVGVRKLTVSDEKGVWLEAENAHMRWRYLDLLRRHFHADLIEVQLVRVERRPTLTEAGEDTGLPVSFHIGRARGRIELEPAFSYERGVYGVGLTLDVARNGDARGQVRAASGLRRGDHLDLDFDLGKKRPLLLRADAEETKGGALAGAMGLPSRQPFRLRVAANGKMSAGRFTAVAMSGAAEPLSAQGAWNKDGGDARGRISLTASALTEPWARRLGPEASFVLVGRRAGPDLYALEARLAAENLRLRAHGLGDLGKRKLGPQGLAVEAQAGALSRIVDVAQMGQAGVVGRATQAGAAWRFDGTAQVQDVRYAGYQLARTSGPLEVIQRAGQWDIKTSLAGVGGRGDGYLAAALGGAPKAALDGARLADGRLLMRTLSVSGYGLKLDAQGARNLLGELTLKGRAQVSNLAAARAGASGSAEATWSAVQGRAGQPWTLALDVRADKFAAGYPELDRLLGAKPQLSARANLQGRRLAVGEASLTGAALKANTAGVLEADGSLKFKLDWQAEGPFHAGPLEITGRAKGSGDVTGALSGPRADLVADLAAIDVPTLPLKDAHVVLSFAQKPDGSSGQAALTASSAYGPARARSEFRFPAGGIDLTGLSVDAGGVKAQGSLSLRARAPSAADLEIAVTQGAFLDAGRVAGSVKIAEASGGARGSLNLTAENVRARGSTVLVRSARLTADGPIARLAYAGQADGTSDGGKWSLNGRGQLAEAKPGYAATFDGEGKLGGRDLKTVETAQIRFGGPERSAKLRLAASDGARIDLDGRLSDANAEVRAQVAGLSLGLVNDDLAGRTDATLTLQGRGGRLDGTLEARLAGARGRGAAANSGVDGTLRGTLAGDGLTLALDATNGQGLKAEGEATLPVEATAAPFRVAIARERPLKGRFLAEGEVRPLFDLLIGGERSLSGRVRTEGTLSGTLNQPAATGSIAVSGGRFDDGGTGLSLRNVALAATFAKNEVDVTQASGVDSRTGSVAGSGRISLLRDGVSSFRLDLKGFRLIDNDIATASATGQATINRGADGKVKLVGNLVIDRADVAARLPTPSGVVAMDVVERNRPADLAASLPPADRTGLGWALDVTLKADRGVFLKGRGLDTELSLDAHVGGTTSDPTLNGQARVVRGDYEFAGKRFEFDPTSVVYLSTHPSGIRLDLTATREDPSLTAEVRIRGTADRPQISLSSSPSLPQDEVLSQVLFGQTASQLSPLEAAQLASAVASMARGGGLDVIGNLRTFARLDRLALAGGGSTGVTVAGGKYLTKDVYLELTGGGKQGPTAEVEWRVKKSLSIVSRVGGVDAESLAVRWRRDY